VQDPTWPVRAAIGSLLCIVGAGLLVVATLFFTFYGFCEDACDGPDRTFWGAVGAAGPYAAVGLAAVLAAALVFGARGVAPAAVGVVSCVVFVGGLVAIAATLAAIDEAQGAGPFVVCLLVFGALWIAATALGARRAGRSP
jgi:hypothetical protein